MNNLQKRFEEENKKILDYFKGKFKDKHRYLLRKEMAYSKWLESQLTWRKVEDGLPAIGVPVLTVSHAGTADITFLLNDGTWDNTLLVTHWLPIPELI